jgi:hypothetical protein
LKRLILDRITIILMVLVCAACDGARSVIAEEEARDTMEGPLPSPGADSTWVHDCAGVEQILAIRSTWHGISESGESHVGRWRGTLGGSAASGFPGSDVLLVVNSDDTGTFTFTSAPPPPPADPADGYLCDGSISGGICGTPSGFVGGFEYELQGVVTRDRVLSFVVLDADPWARWCELQTPVERADTSQPCGISWDVVPLSMERWAATGCEQVDAAGNAEPIDCSLMYALERCKCAYDGCFASFYSGIEVGLNLSADADELSGSLWFKSNVDAALLRLRREAP